MAGWLVLAIWMSVDSSAVQRATFTHVRSSEPRVRETIADGYLRSATFRALVDAIEKLSCVVYVTTVVKLSQGMRGALLHQPAGRREMPVLRVLVKRNLSRDEAIATIGHELQHVVEAMSGPAGSGIQMAALFAGLDATQGRDVRKYKTDAAVDVTRQVHDELRHRPKLRSGGFSTGDQKIKR